MIPFLCEVLICCEHAFLSNLYFLLPFFLFSYLPYTVTPNNSSDPPRLLNYLTAPHVLVWSAAVASSSLPGVFEANRLMVKDADGTVRYESAERAKFSDGSMEQDLPMQQLSEMFNVNHFIVSQANPHAVMFASYNQNRSIWINPVTGLINSVLTFLKDRCRSWLANVVELVGARRIAPLHATSRGMMAQFFTQEYEGRDCDISLIPWINHRSALSALLHCIYNPKEDEFREWIEAAERETWKYIPAIKSHIAEEVTLDRCVQRLRKRLVQESWDKRRNLAQSSSAGRKMGERVPSFFTSPSLVNLGGLGVGDRASIEGLDKNSNEEAKDGSNTAASVLPAAETPIVDVHSGWGGMGLRGNRSSNSLERSASNASGLFIDGEDHPPASPEEHKQSAGEQTVPTATVQNRSPSATKLIDGLDNGKYYKTTSMANFYYRRSGGGSHGNLLRTRSQGQVDDSKPTNEQKSDSNDASSTPGSMQGHNRRLSKSHTDLMSTYKEHEKQLHEASGDK